MPQDWLYLEDELGESPFTRLQRAEASAAAALRNVLMQLDATGPEAEEPPIHSAAREGRVADVRAELEKGVDLDIENELGWTPLFWAGVNGNLDLAKLLCNRGADVNHRDNAYTGLTPYGLARLMDYEEVVEHLGRHGGCR